MCALECRDDALEACQLISCSHRLVIVYSHHLHPTLIYHMRMHGTYTGIVESGRYAERLFYLSVRCLHHERTRAVQDAFRSAMHRSRRPSRADAASSRLGKYHPHTHVIGITIHRSGRVASSSDTGYEIIRIVASCLFLQLPSYFL